MRRAPVVFPVHGSPTVKNSVGCLIAGPNPSAHLIIAETRACRDVRAKPSIWYTAAEIGTETDGALLRTAIAENPCDVRGCGIQAFARAMVSMSVARQPNARIGTTLVFGLRNE